MIELTLRRILETPNSTAGIMMHGAKVMGFVIEDGARADKVYGMTRIPSGFYKITKRNAGKFYEKYNARWGHRYVLHLSKVPNYEFILIHIGNTTEETKGCLLLNDTLSFNREKNEWQGGESTYCYQRFYKYIDSLNDDQITIEIK